MVSPDGFKYKCALEFKFSTSNNAAEYEALIGGLQLVQEIRVKCVQVFSDSQLVVNQVSGTFEAKKPSKFLLGIGQGSFEQIRISNGHSNPQEGK